MGKATGVGTIVFGVLMIILGIGAYFSGEESSQTSQGRMAIGIVIILGLGLILSGLNAREKANAKEKQASQVPQTVTTVQTVQTVTEPLPPPPPPDVPSTLRCSACGREVQADFVACPFCGKSLKSKCPSCGKQVQQDFVACPYCGTALKKLASQ